MQAYRVVQIGRLISKVLSAGSDSPRPWRFRIAAVVVLLTLFWPVSEYLRLVLRNPQRTGLLVISTTYSAPWDVNPWSAENVATLERLDKHNLSLRRLSDPSALIYGQWAELLDDVEHLAVDSDRDQPLLVYINLHGVVASDGSPCLLVHDSQPLESSTWLSLDRLVNRIREALPGPRPLVIALESGRLPTVVPQVQQQNFADAVRSWFSRLQSTGQAQKLAVIVSSSSEFGSIKHAGKACDLFTSCLAEALSGECDATRYGGNHNQQVEWPELVSYVHDQVEQQSRTLRVVPQFTEHFGTTEQAPTFLAWSTALPLSALTNVDSAEPTAAQLEELAQAWRRIYTLQAAHPWHEQPYTWGALKRKMVAWEQSLLGGADVQSQAPACARSAMQIVMQLESLVQNRQHAAGLEQRLCSRAQQLWQQLAESPERTTAQRIVDSEMSGVQASQLCAVPMLAQVVHRQELHLWQDSQRLKRLAQIESQIERVRSSRCETPGLAELSEIELDVDSLRRQLEDMASVDRLDSTWDALSVELETRIGLWGSKCEQVRTAIAFNEQMLARLPATYQAIDLIDAACETEQPIAHALAAIVNSIEHNRDRFATAIGAATIRAAKPANDPDSGDRIGDLHVPTIEAQQLFTQLALRWQRTLFDTKSEPSTKALAFEALLESGLLPVEIGSIDKAVQLRLATHQRLRQSPGKLEQSAMAAPVAELAIGRSARNAIAQWISCAESEQESVEEGRAAGTVPAIHLTNPVLNASRLDHQWLMNHTARGLTGFGLGEQLSLPVVAWQETQRQQRALETSARWLEDFWKLPQSDDKDYFAAAVCAVMADSSEDQQLTSQRRLQEMVNAASNGLRLECRCRPVWNQQPETITNCRIVQGSSCIPGGLASLGLVESGRAGPSISPSVVVQVGEPNSTQAVQLLTTLSNDTELRPAVARLNFRGHQFVSDFNVHPRITQASRGVTTGPGPSTITVQSAARQPRARMIVLDCSASMYAPQPTEGLLGSTQLDPHSQDRNQGQPAGNATASTASSTPTRLDAARLALKEILAQWRGRPDHLGVMLYGHRVTLVTTEQGKLIQPRYLKRYPFSQEIEAYEDVETILTPGRFRDQEYAEVVERLESVVPWGQTPLYLAVLQASQELRRQAAKDQNPASIEHSADGRTFSQPRVDLDVIVISDGRNYQFNAAPDKQVTLEQAIQHARQSGVRVHVIGFGIADSEKLQATQEFTQLAQQTGGSVCMDVQTAMQLVERIDTLTEPESYRVRLPDGQWLTETCGKATTVPAVQVDNTPIMVEYQRTSTLVPLNPHGELLLAPASPNRLVRVQPTFYPTATSSISTFDGHVSPFDIVISKPEQTESKLAWQIGLQRRDEQVAQRPRYCWLEVMPSDEGDALPDAVYVVCDPLWKSGTSEPVLTFETQAWPSSAQRARIKFWCSDLLPPPVVTFQSTARDLAQEWTWLEDDRPGDGKVAYQLQAEPDGITLVLLHGQPSEVLELMPIIRNLPSETTVHRRYCPAQRISIHRFTHAELRTQPMLDIAIHSVPAFKQQSLRSTSTLEIKLPRLIH